MEIKLKYKDIYHVSTTYSYTPQSQADLNIAATNKQPWIKNTSCTNPAQVIDFW